MPLSLATPHSQFIDGSVCFVLKTHPRNPTHLPLPVQAAMTPRLGFYIRFHFGTVPINFLPESSFQNVVAHARLLKRSV